MFSNLVLKGFKNYKISGNFLGNSDSLSPEVGSGILLFFFFFESYSLYTFQKVLKIKQVWRKCQSVHA